MKIALGTVQFGLDYGISNNKGIVPADEVKRILSFASLNGIDILDTAPGYGSSEERLGEMLGKQHSFKIITKTLSVKTLDEENIKSVRETFESSLEKTGQEKVYGLLLHHVADKAEICNAGTIFESLSKIKSEGLAEKIGVSAYFPEQVERILELSDLDIIQIPINVFDRRFLKNDFLKKMKDRGIEIHARSIFLQGLLLMHLETIPEIFYPWLKAIKKYRDKIESSELVPVQAAIGFFRTLKEVDAVVIGVETVDNLREIVEHFNGPQPNFDYEPYGIEDEKILNPANWSL